MKFTCASEVDLPREKTVALFLDTSRYAEWQEGFVSITPVKGEPWSKDSQARVIYKNGSMVIDLKETIVSNHLPESLVGLYEHEHMVNTMANRFTDLGGRTRYEVEINYSKFIGLVPKLMALLMPGVFRRQVQKRLDAFKKFAEEN